MVWPDGSDETAVFANNMTRPETKVVIIEE